MSREATVESLVFYVTNISERRNWREDWREDSNSRQDS